MGFLDFLSGKKGSKEEAKNRLKIVLIQDRAMLSDKTLQKIRDEIIKVIAKYVDIDAKELKVDISSDNRKSSSMMIVANVPIKKEADRDRNRKKN